jgi:hypothetical protein
METRLCFLIAGAHTRNSIAQTKQHTYLNASIVLILVIYIELIGFEPDKQEASNGWTSFILQEIS